MMIPKDMNEVGGIWIRQHRGKVQILVETGDEEWRQIFCEPMDPTTPTSHIVEPGGVRMSPRVDTGGDFEPIEERGIQEGRRCPKCAFQMIHTRLRGYICQTCGTRD